MSILGRVDRKVGIFTRQALAVVLIYFDLSQEILRRKMYLTEDKSPPTMETSTSVYRVIETMGTLEGFRRRHGY